MDLHFLVALTIRSFAILSQGLLTIIQNRERVVLNYTTASLWLCFLVYTVLKKRDNLVFLSVGLTLIAMNFVMIGLSDRSAMGVDFIATIYRYYFELMLLVIIFLRLIVSDIAFPAVFHNPFQRLSKELRSIYFQGIALVIYALCSFVSYYHIIHSNHIHFSRYPKTREYINNLITGIERIKADRPQNLSFDENGMVPAYVLGYYTDICRFSEFLRIFDLEPLFGISTQNYYRINKNGEVEKLAPDKCDIRS
jgi:hypothetical protein